MASKNLLDILNMSIYYPQKLSYDRTISLEKDSSDSQYHGIKIIRDLLQFDYRTLNLNTTEINKSLRGSTSEMGDTETPTNEENKSRKFMFATTTKDTKSATDVHTLDIVVALFNCCDDFLRQILVERMMTCRLGIPLLLPEITNGSQTMLLWALRSLRLDIPSSLMGSLNETLIEVPNPIVSFIRVGTLLRSKSELLNAFLNQAYDTFYHRASPNGKAERKISNGMIEVAWYQSIEKLEPDGQFPCHLSTLLNLRGNATDFLKQTRFLCEASSIVVIMTDSVESLRDLYAKSLDILNLSQTIIIVAFVSPDAPRNEESDAAFLESCNNREKLADVVYDWTADRKSMNFREWKDTVKSKICEHMKANTKNWRALVDIIKKSKEYTYKSDEENFIDNRMASAKIIASDLILSLQKRSSDNRDLIPLQGEHLKNLSKLERELQRNVDSQVVFVGDFIKPKEEKKIRLRNLQFEDFLKMNEAMRTFYKKVVSSDNGSQYLLKWLRPQINALTQKTFAEIRKKLECDKRASGIVNDTGSDLEAHLCKGLESDQGFGFHYLLREIGQIYEVVSSEEKRNGCEKKMPLKLSEVKSFPKVVSQLMLGGQEIELMDGDASYVPLDWLKAVFDEISSENKDARIFVVSVIGVQSSGKSTLLNSLFGLHFEVSAGRCTRGINCHLIRNQKTADTCSTDYPQYNQTIANNCTECGYHSPYDRKKYDSSDDDYLSLKIETSSYDGEYCSLWEDTEEDNDYLSPINEHKKTSSSEYDYLLVLDAEGFRAPEFTGSSTVRDNELATFIVGLSDVTIINVKGENWSEMEDILQIVVHALLRIRQTKHDIKFMPSCMFVHQNVSVANSEEKIQSGRKRQLSYLDKMVAEAAHREGFTNIEAFCKVINFCENSDILYFPDLWFGTPPMATINPGYTKATQNLKDNLFKTLASKHSLPISDFFFRISDLWNAILQENFVFNFRNTKEMLAYSSVSTKISDICWDMRKCNHRLQNELVNKILSCKTIDEVKNFEENQDQIFNKKFKHNSAMAKQRLNETLAALDYQEILEKFRSQYEHSFLCSVKEEVIRIKRDIERITEIQKTKLKNCQEIVTKYEQEFHKFIKDEAAEYSRRGKTSDSAQIDSHFNEKWKKWLSAQFDIEGDLKKAIVEGNDYVKKSVLKELRKLTRNKKEETALENALKLYFQSADNSDYYEYEIHPTVTENDFESRAVVIKQTEDIHETSRVAEANSRCVELYDRCMSYVDDLKGLDVEISHIQHIVSDIAAFFGISFNVGNSEDDGKRSEAQDSPEDWEKTRNVSPNNDASQLQELPRSHLNFTRDIVFRYSAFICWKAYNRLISLKKEFISKTSALVEIERQYKPQAKVEFMSAYVRESEKLAAEYFAEVLVDAAVDTIIGNLGEVVSTTIRDNSTQFRTKRSFLIKLLSDLVNDNALADYKLLVQSYETLSRRKIRKFLEESVKTETIRNSIVSQCVDNLKALLKYIKLELELSQAKCSGNIEVFLINFQTKITGKITFQNDCARLISRENLSNIDVFVKHVTQAIENLQKQKMELFLNPVFDLLTNSSKTDPVKELLSIVIGCQEKCPFCSAPCYQAKNHGEKHRTIHCSVSLVGTLEIKGTTEHKKGKLSVRSSNQTKHKLVLDTCNGLVQTGKYFRLPHTTARVSKWYNIFKKPETDRVTYKDYQRVYPDWYIPTESDLSYKISDYWKWFVVKFGKDLAKEFNAMCPPLNDDWLELTEQHAKSRLAAIQEH